MGDTEESIVMKYLRILSIVGVLLVTVRAEPQLLRQLINLLGVKGDSMTNRLVMDQENTVNRQFRARNMASVSQAAPDPRPLSRGSPSPNCVCRCDCCPCCPCEDDQYQYVDT